MASASSSGDPIDALSPTVDHRGLGRATRLCQPLLKACLRLGLAVHAMASGLAGRRRAPSRADKPAYDVVLTLNFHAAGWPVAVLGPLARSRRCERLRVVTTAVVPEIPGVEAIHPSRFLCRVCGKTAARLLTFVVVCYRTRPDVVGGVHLLLNGLLAALVARLIGSRSLYICVGGPKEVAGGGLWSENRLFGKLGVPDPTIERRLIQACDSFDVIVTMGTRAVRYFRDRGVHTRCHVVPSGVDGTVYRPGHEVRDVDVIVLARLVPLKRIDLALAAIREIADVLPSVQAAIIGEGPLRGRCEALATELSLGEHVRFLGYQPDVSAWLRRAKVFLLTSDSEGLSIALVEAMASGTVPITSDVGDLGDVLDHGVNGFLVEERSGAAFGRVAVEVLADEARWHHLSASAISTARRYTPTAIAERWDTALSLRPPGYLD